MTDLFRAVAARRRHPHPTAEPRRAAEAGVADLPAVLVPALFRIGLSLHVTAARSDDEQVVRDLREAIDALDEVIATLRRAALADLRRQLGAPQPGAAGGGGGCWTGPGTPS